MFKSDMASYKEAYEMYVANELAKNAEFDRTTLNVTYQDDEFSDIFGNVSDRYKEGLKIVDGVLVYESTDEAENEVLNEVGMIPKISKKKSYVGCFVDITGNGKADGVIFADLCIQSYGDVSQVSESVVKDYKITQESYTVPDAPGYGTHPLLTAIGSGEDRFYVMKLSDYIGRYDVGEFTWSTQDLADEYDFSTMTSVDFGTGKQNSKNMLRNPFFVTGSPDQEGCSIWTAINYDYTGFYMPYDWDAFPYFVPSRGEWEVFHSNVVGSSTDFESFGLATIYFSSSVTDGGVQICVFQDAQYNGVYVSTRVVGGRYRLCTFG